jgi:hypothetical protein
VFSTGLYYFEDREAVTFNEMKYIRFFASDREEMYDLRSDPGEKISVLSSNPRVRSVARTLLAGHEDESIRTRNLYGLTDDKQPVLDRNVRKRLEALGYIK